MQKTFPLSLILSVLATSAAAATTFEFRFPTQLSLPAPAGNELPPASAEQITPEPMAPPALPEERVTISTGSNIVLSSYFSDAASSPKAYVFEITGSVKSVSTGTFAAGSSVKIVNKGVISGLGGRGGSASGGSGSKGGPALVLNYPVTIQNEGTLQGGGGGGGAGASCNSGTGASYSGGGGGGGAGDPGGYGGGSGATAGTTSSGGAGGPGKVFESWGHTFWAGKGGSGGGWGQAGSPGSGAQSTSGYSACRGSGGAGGAPGEAVKLNGFTATFEVRGTIRGPET